MSKVTSANTQANTIDNTKSLPKDKDQLFKLLFNHQMFNTGKTINENPYLTKDQKDALQKVIETGDAADIDLPVVGLTNIARLTKDSQIYLVMKINGHRFAFESSTLQISKTTVEYLQSLPAKSNQSHPKLPKNADDLDKLLSNDRILYYGNSISENKNLTQEQKDALQQVIETGDAADIDLPVVGLTNIARLTKNSQIYLVMKINGHEFAFETSSLKYQFQVDKKTEPTPQKDPMKAFDTYIREPLNAVTAKLGNISFEVRQPSEVSILNYLGSNHIQQLKDKTIDCVKVSIPPFGNVLIFLNTTMKTENGEYSNQLTYRFDALGSTHYYRYPSGSFIKSEKATTKTQDRSADLTK